MFRDEAEITVVAGDGGNGCVAFRREKFAPRGGPDGGDGGRGGSVILRSDPHVTTLYQIARSPVYRAANGGPGEGGLRHGRNGEDVVICVPVGTVVRDVDRDILIRDLREGGQEVCVAEGGNGGFGNRRFASSVNRTPRRANPGAPGDRRRLRLELKLVADVGLVGLPNAGKSTLIARLTRATPRIADYPFTTVVPNLGIVELSSWRRCVMVDIPGLIEGASQGVGLGDRFLRHVERTRVLVHMIDAAPPAGPPPAEAAAVVLSELGKYSPVLLRKPRITVLTKCDQLEDPEAAALAFRRETGIDAFPISAVSGHGLDVLLRRIEAALGEGGEPAAGA